MIKASIFASILTIATGVGLATWSGSASADEPCQRKDFKTEMVRDACAKGGQKAAKDAMKQFMKEAKIKSCNQCHSKLAPTYENKPDAVEQFKKAGGKLIEAK